jgi:SAM-dependent methyltransferase
MTEEDYISFNRTQWELASDEYQEEHDSDLSGERAAAWGTWRIPEDELRLLGDVRDKDVLELGCGAARWSIALAERGARAVGLDLSTRQLEHARGLNRAGDVSLVQASAHSTPLRTESFDVVFSDYGATTFADPYQTVPEVARILRSAGTFAFVTSSPLLMMTWPEELEEPSTTLYRDYFGMHRFEFSDGVEFQLPHGEWIRLFRANGFEIQDLIEIQPPEGATTTYEGRPLSWARRWPAEDVWRLRKK